MLDRLKYICKEFLPILLFCHPYFWQRDYISWGQKSTVYTLLYVATESLITIYQLCDIRKSNEMQKELGILIWKLGELSSATCKDEKKWANRKY